MNSPSQSNTNTAAVSLVAATAIVIADMVGVGVFTSLGFQVQGLSSPLVVLLLWLVGGAVALCGAFCYAELAAMFPRSSGEYNFLTHSFGAPVGFLAGWLSATVGFSAPVALAAMALGEYAKSFWPGAPPMLLGLGSILLVSTIHLSGVRQGSIFQVGTTALKLAVIAAFIVFGAFASWRAPVVDLKSTFHAEQIFTAPFAISLVFVMYAYSGWNAATYIVGEIRNPQKNLPRALFLGTGLVIFLYVALNAVFLLTTPIPEMAGKINVAQIAGVNIFGASGGRLVDALISIGLVSTVSAMMWIGPRVTMVMGEDMPALRPFAQRTKNGAPAFATLVQMAVASLMLFSQSFEAILEFTQFSLTFCSFLTVLGMVKLRYTRPDISRPYRAWGYPLTPLVFLSVTLYMMYYLLETRPLQSLAGLAVMAAGLLVYALVSSAQIGAMAGRLSKLRLGLIFAVAALGGLCLAAPKAQAASADDNARFLAGLPIPADSPLAPLTKTAAWENHARSFDQAFKLVDAAQLSHVRNWAKDNLNLPKRPNLFYLFSGPDFLYANAFFPDRQTYVMAGLEPPGTPPDVSKIPEKLIPTALQGLERATRTILQVSFFRTAEMSGQFSLTPTKGTLPVLYVFLARSGKVVHDAQLVRLLENGEIVEGEKATDPAAVGTKGAKIVFSSPGGPDQTLYYFQANVINGSFAKTGLDALFAKLGDGDALVKSASYLLHGTPFSDVRNSLLNRSSAILQDDTGVPYRMYGAGWTVKPFGHYSRPIPIFHYAWQGDLAKLFEKESPSALPFGIGYRWRPNQSSLVLAVKKEVKAAASAPGASAPSAAAAAPAH
jgi:basic amino acid/polyamine antiporter, APA family